MKVDKFKENDFVSVNYSIIEEKNDMIVVTISGVGHEDQSETYILLEDSMNFSNLIGITNKKRDFFLNECTEELFQYIETYVGKFERKILISHSMGGYLGFLLNERCAFDFCFICSPYLSLDCNELSLKSEEIEALDKKLNYFRIEDKKRSLVKLSSINHINEDSFFIVFDPYQKEDEKLFSLVSKKFPGMFLLLLPDIGHLSLYVIERSRTLSEYMIKNIGKNIDKNYIYDLALEILTWYSKKISDKKSNYFVLNQIYYIKQQKDKICYFEFLLKGEYIPHVSEYRFVLNKYGYILCFNLSEAGYCWYETPFLDGESLPVLFKKEGIDVEYPFAYYNEKYTKIDNKELVETLSSFPSENRMFVDFSERSVDFLYEKLNYHDGLNILAVLNYNDQKYNPREKGFFHTLKKSIGRFYK
ncbi:hypothetical protein [Gluconacetobacter tumulicola]|uniref:Alpha/beta hydrolase n=1 Tax=Gluconacetobacter tumulicola TaxID=1017177 RepID=A0A7W4P837_9PROT|nr:hypothetical protein [Gluconacetobacter tumulicola]MBB2181046.1 hypothetical protein [Gluconacetobacter tumulicola]